MSKKKKNCFCLESDDLFLFHVPPTSGGGVAVLGRCWCTMSNGLV